VQQPETKTPETSEKNGNLFLNKNASRRANLWGLEVISRQPHSQVLSSSGAKLISRFADVQGMNRT